MKQRKDWMREVIHDLELGPRAARLLAQETYANSRLGWVMARCIFEAGMDIGGMELVWR